MFQNKRKGGTFYFVFTKRNFHTHIKYHKQQQHAYEKEKKTFLA